MAREISRGWRGQDMMVVALLDGSVVFLADLIRCLHKERVKLTVEFVKVSSYGKGRRSTGLLQWHSDFSSTMRGRPILLVDDIVDTGLTMKEAVERLRTLSPSSIRTCTLLLKEKKEVREFDPDFVGFSIPDIYVVGYGLDYAGRYRELPCIGILQEGE